jgi:Uncharacterised BCR, YnfA/UPF0060 family
MTVARYRSPISPARRAHKPVAPSVSIESGRPDRDRLRSVLPATRAHCGRCHRRRRMGRRRSAPAGNRWAARPEHQRHVVVDPPDAAPAAHLPGRRVLLSHRRLTRSIRCPMTIGRSVLLFGLAALFEIGGAWLIWQGVREHRGWLWMLGGVIALGAYGFVATSNPATTSAAPSRPTVASSSPPPSPGDGCSTVTGPTASTSSAHSPASPESASSCTPREPESSRPSQLLHRPSGLAAHARPTSAAAMHAAT